ncbi:glycosyltransferase family 4 protein [candidate division CSSED10-310 bacterium]|uniref:Glycosyltransferase family 4 protein n=1 Tax=candidate division CSSED10-310 bacterium TaxID=2855610 RepID=A0ABV6YSU7_UNCC1
MEYSAQTDRHYYHLYSFIDRLAEHLDLRLIISRTLGHPQFNHVTDIKSRPQKKFNRLWLFNEIWRAYRQGYRLFYCHYTFGAAVFTSLLTRFFGGKTYFWYCIMLDVLLREHNVSLYSPGILIFRLGSRIIDTFITGSEFMKDYYQQKFNIARHKIIVLPNYIDVSRFTPRPEEKKTYRKQLSLPAQTLIVLFVHGMEKGKGGAQLVPIARSVVKQVPNMLFLVVGDGSEKPEIEREIQHHGLTDHFRLLGRIPNTDIPDYYKAADVFIMPSLYEEFSRTLLEAMAAGVPFVATDGRGGTYSYTSSLQHEFVVASHDVEGFAQKLITLLQDENLRKKMSVAGQQQVENFSEQTVLNKFLEQLVYSQKKTRI